MPILPALPTEGQDPWFTPRDSFDGVVRELLEGPLDPPNIAATVIVTTGTEPRPIDVGDGVVIWVDKDEHGAPNAQPQDLIFTSDGGGSLPVPVTGTYVTALLAANAREQGLIDLGRVYDILVIQVSGPSRVRLYDTVAHATTDATRPRGTEPDPLQNHGVMMDYAFQTGQTRTITPVVTGVVLGGGIAAAIIVDNLDVASAVVTVHITHLRTA